MQSNHLSNPPVCAIWSFLGFINIQLRKGGGCNFCKQLLDTLYEYVSAIYPHVASQLSDGIVGGGTAFPKLGVVAFPVKGSVVYWHSLENDGQTDVRSLHGGCPTVLGVKWGERERARASFR